MIRRPVHRWLGAAAVLLSLAAIASPASAQLMDRARYLYLLADNFEQASGLDGQPILLEGDLWYGGDYNRLWVKVDGNADTERGAGEVETQALFSRTIAPYWDAQIGARVDAEWGDRGRSREHLALGIQGLAPYWFEVETAVFVSTSGAVSATFQANYDLLLTQRLVLEPDVEVDASFRDEPEWNTASGLTDSRFALRLRYEFRREFAPYVGYLWQRSYGGTADLRREAGLPWRQGTFVAGLRMWH